MKTPENQAQPRLHKIPTVQELGQMKMARPVEFTSKGVPTVWTITDEGNALLGRLMRENAAMMRKHPRLSPHTSAMKRAKE